MQYQPTNLPIITHCVNVTVWDIELAVCILIFNIENGCFGPARKHPRHEWFGFICEVLSQPSISFGTSRLFEILLDIKQTSVLALDRKETIQRASARMNSRDRISVDCLHPLHQTFSQQGFRLWALTQLKTARSNPSPNLILKKRPHVCFFFPLSGFHHLLICFKNERHHKPNWPPGEQTAGQSDSQGRLQFDIVWGHRIKTQW